ncbi:MAG: lipoxygenase family protein [Myxococcota bacterium]
MTPPLPSFACCPAPAPCLPQGDPEPEDRAAGIARARAGIALSRRFAGLPFPDRVPGWAKPGPRFLAEAGRWSALAAANLAAAEARALATDANASPSDLLRRAKRALFVRVQETLNGTSPARRIAGWQERTPLATSAYRIFPLVPEPQALNRWRSDLWFARERVAGANPVMLEGVERLPAHVTLRPGDYARAMDGDTLDAALAERRLFQCDHGMLSGIEAGITDGNRKFLEAPWSLYALPRDRSALRPLAIQCTQAPTPGPLFFPWHGTAWRMARTVVQVSDSNLHGVVEHGVHCHLVMGLVAVCLHRSLARRHPLSVLLLPHLELTLNVDHLTEGLYAPGGRTPTIQSVSERGTLTLARWAYRSFDWSADAVPERFVARRVSADVLPHYPARDDLEAHGTVLRAFVRAYVRIYYASDGDVAGDGELQDFVRRLGDPDEGGLRGLGEVATVDALETFLVRAIQRATSYHAAINYSVYDAMGYAPNMPMAQFGPGPRHTDHPEEDFLAMLPPAAERDRQFNDVFVVAQLRANRLGHYPLEHFQDRRVRPLVRDFREALAELEHRIAMRNARTEAAGGAPYTVLLPSRVTASVHV